MAGFEHQLVSKVIRTGEVATAIEWGISLDDFLLPETKQIWSEILDVYQHRDAHGSVPGENYISQLFPTFIYVHDDTISVEILCGLVRKNRIDAESRLIAEELLEDSSESPTKKINTALEKLSRLAELGESRNCDVTFKDAFVHIKEEYELATHNIIPSKVQYPWDALNEETRGIAKDDYVILYGRPKSFKSWILCYLISRFMSTGLRILLYTKEMNPHGLFKRIAACHAEVDYQKLRMGGLGVDEEKFWDTYDSVTSWMESDSTVCLAGQDVAEGGDTVAWLKSKVEKYRPDIVLVDGIYLMSSSVRGSQKTHERVESISRSARQMVLSTGVPLIATAQANRKAAGHRNAEFDEIAHSDALGQDATAIFRVMYDKDQQQVILRTAGSREWQLEGFCLNAKPAYDFNYIGLMDAESIQKAQDRDDKMREDEDGPHAAPQSARNTRGRRGGGKGNGQSREEKCVKESIQLGLDKLGGTAH